MVRLVETIERESRSAQWLADMVWVAVYTGMRRSELTSLKWDDVHWEEDKIRVQGETSKSQKDRWIPMTPTVVEVLEDRRGDSDLAWVFTHSNGKIKGNTASTMFRTYARKAGFEEISLHGLRHTACSWLAMQGASIEAIREFAGHSTTGVTEKYMHLSPKAYHDQVRDAFDSV